LADLDWRCDELYSLEKLLKGLHLDRTAFHLAYHHNVGGDAIAGDFPISAAGALRKV
jgi:hypothetical protein